MPSGEEVGDDQTVGGGGDDPTGGGGGGGDGGTPARPVVNTKLKIAIIKSGLAQYTIAERLRISVFRLSRIVCGKQAPTADEQDQLAELLHAPRRALFRVVTLLLVIGITEGV